MAGSLQHVLHSWNLIEDMGDAYELTEELLFIILEEIGEEKAKEILDSKFYPMMRGDEPESESFIRVHKLMQL